MLPGLAKYCLLTIHGSAVDAYITLDGCVLCHMPTTFGEEIAVGGFSPHISVVAVLMLWCTKVIGLDSFLGWTGFFIPSTRADSPTYVVAENDSKIKKQCKVSITCCQPDRCPDRYRKNHAMCFHQQCFEVLRGYWDKKVPGPTMKEIWALGSATKLLHMPNDGLLQKRYLPLVSASLSDEKCHIATRLPSNIATTLDSSSNSIHHLLSSFRRLPEELQNLIVTYAWPSLLFSAYATIYQSEMLIHRMRALEIKKEEKKLGPLISTSSPIYAGYVRVDESNYLSYLSNESLMEDDSLICEKKQIFQFRITTDELGIRGIELFDHEMSTIFNKPVSRSNGELWYQVVRPYDHKKINYINTFTQNPILRDMGIDGELSLDPAVRKVLKWDTPEPPTLDTRYFYRNSTHRTTREPIRMRHIPLREDIKGIIASILMDLTDCNSVNSLYALYEGSDPKPIYSRQHLDGHSQRWFFFPIAGNERVSEVWVQIRKSWSDPGRWHKPSIAFRTTENRSCIFGDYVGPTKENDFEFIRLNDDSGSVVTSLCCNATDCEQEFIEMIGVTHDSQKLANTNGLPPKHDPVFGFLNHSRIFASHASLENIISIQTCTGPIQTYQGESNACIGLLFTYQDRTMSAVGQWRWDLQIDQISWTKDETPIVCCTRCRIPEVYQEVEIEVIAKNDVFSDERQEHRQGLQGRMNWCVSYGGNLITFD